MQEPPPVETLLEAMKRFARDVAEQLSRTEIVWHTRQQEDEWSLTEVVCHLRDVEREVHQTRFQALIQADGVFLPGATADAWVSERRYCDQDGVAALHAFLDARAQTLALIDGVDASTWRRTGQHAFFGPTTMHELLYLVVQHDQAHWEQIAGLLDA